MLTSLTRLAGWIRTAGALPCSRATVRYDSVAGDAGPTLDTAGVSVRGVTAVPRATAILACPTVAPFADTANAFGAPRALFTELPTGTATSDIASDQTLVDITASGTGLPVAETLLVGAALTIIADHLSTERRASRALSGIRGALEPRLELARCATAIAVGYAAVVTFLSVGIAGAIAALGPWPKMDGHRQKLSRLQRDLEMFGGVDIAPGDCIDSELKERPAELIIDDDIDDFSPGVEGTLLLWHDDLFETSRRISRSPDNEARDVELGGDREPNSGHLLVRPMSGAGEKGECQTDAENKGSRLLQHPATRPL